MSIVFVRAMPVPFVEDSNVMNTPLTSSFRRMVCAVCALALLLTVLSGPAAYAAAPQAPPAALTAAEAQQMQQADQAVSALTNSPEFAALEPEARMQAAVDCLHQLSADGLVQPGSIYADMENDLVSYAYTCGAWGGVLLETPELENFELGEPPLSPAPSRAGTSGSAMVYYAFDDASSSTRYPYYAYMQAFWTALGLDTRMDSAVTVSDLRQMDRYDLCVLSAHGAYYTYQTGLLLRRLRTQPVILLTERSTLYKDLLYGFDLLCHRVIKVNGRYCITPDFFRSAYWGGRLDGTIVYSETCEFYGMDGSVDLAMADALLAGGAEAVVGFVNNVYAVYARSMLWATVNFMIAGDPVATAVQRSMDLYGTDDLIWYHSQGGRRPHAAAAYPLIQGRADAVLPTLPAPAPQQAA